MAVVPPCQALPGQEDSDGGRTESRRHQKPAGTAARSPIFTSNRPQRRGVAPTRGGTGVRDHRELAPGTGNAAAFAPLPRGGGSNLRAAARSCRGPP